MIDLSPESRIKYWVNIYLSECNLSSPETQTLVEAVADEMGWRLCCLILEKAPYLAGEDDTLP